METILSIGRYLALLLISGITAMFTPMSLVNWYKEKFPEPGGFGPDFLELPAYFVITLGIFAFLTVVFGRSIFRFKQVYIILGITLLLAMISDPRYFYVYPIVILSGSALGLLVRFILTIATKKKLVFQDWKKYF